MIVTYLRRFFGATNKAAHNNAKRLGEMRVESEVMTPLSGPVVDDPVVVVGIIVPLSSFTDTTPLVFSRAYIKVL